MDFFLFILIGFSVASMASESDDNGNQTTSTKGTVEKRRRVVNIFLFFINKRAYEQLHGSNWKSVNRMRVVRYQQMLKMLCRIACKRVTFAWNCS